MFAVILCATGHVQAQVTGINSGSSIVTNAFLDYSSENNLSQAGAVYIAGNTAWNGGAWNLTQTDPTTGDSANGTITGAWSGNNYSLNLSPVNLSQTATDTGYADLLFVFSVDFQLGGAGLPSQATLSPTFLVSGTILHAGSYVSVTGSINYYGDFGSGPNFSLDTVNYNWTFNNGGNAGNFFNQSVSGTPVGGTTPALIPGSDLRMTGDIDFRVDPSVLQAQAVPEPSSGVLMALAGVGGILWRRIRH